MIEARGLSKSYGETHALRDASFRIAKGEIVGLLGPNGAGKTTAMKILTGFLVPNAGEALVDGFDVVEEPLAVQARIGYLPENAPLYHDMLAGDYLAFVARMRGLDPAAGAGRSIRNAVDECGIGDVLGRPIGQLSKGYRQRVGLAASLLHDPEILILDEPTTGLDPNQIVEVRDLIRRMGERKTVILSTHILPEVEATCGRAVILIQGRVRADGALDELTQARSIVATVGAPDEERAREHLGSLAGVERADVEAREGGFVTLRLVLSDGLPGERVAEAVAEQGWPLRELRRDDRTLEQVFRELTETAAEVAS